MSKLNLALVVPALLACAPEPDGAYRGIYIPANRLLIRSDGTALRVAESPLLPAGNEMFCVVLDGQPARDKLLRLSKVFRTTPLKGNERDRACRFADSEVYGFWAANWEGSIVALPDGRYFKRGGGPLFSPKATAAFTRAQTAAGKEPESFAICFEGRGVVLRAGIESYVYVSQVGRIEPVLSAAQPISGPCAEAMKVAVDHNKPPPPPPPPFR